MKNEVFRNVIIRMRMALALMSLLMLLGAGGAFAQITMGIGSVTAKAGDTVLVPINVTNFNNVGAISLKIGYNSTATKFVDVKNAPTGVTFTSSAAGSVITLGWFDATASSPINLGTGVLVNVRVVYNSGTGAFTFNAAQSEIANGAGVAVPVTYTNGAVSPVALGLSIGSVQGVMNSTVTVPITTTNFTEVGAVSLKITYDPARLQFDSIANVPSSMSFTKGATGGVITLGWFDATGNTPVTIASGGKLLDLKFTYKGGTSALTFIAAQSDVADKSGNSFTVQYANGQVTPAPGEALTLTLPDLSLTAGGRATIPLTVEKFSNVGAVSIKLQYNAAVLTFDSIGNTARSGFSASASSGVLTLAWFDATGITPLTVGENGTGKLLDLNFTYNGGSSALTFVAAQTEIADRFGVTIPVLYKNGSVVSNVKPTFNTIPAISKNELDTVRFVVTAIDPNTADVLTYSATGLPTGATFTAATRTFLWVPALKTAGSYTVKFFVTDGSLKDSTTATITITKNNLKPAFTKVMKDTTILENQALTYTYTATDANGDAVTYSLSGTVPAGAAINSGTGILTWTPTYLQSGVYTIVVKAADPAGLFDSTTAKVTVTNVNRKPVLVSKTPTTLDSVKTNNVISFKVSVSDADNEVLTYTWRLNDVVQTSKDSTYSVTFTVKATAQKVVCVFADPNGGVDSARWDFRTTYVSVINPIDLVPAEFSLNQNYPNPFNPTTSINFGLPKAAPVTLEIYNILGSKVRTLLNGTTMSAAYHNVVWDGRNDAGVQVSSGMYLYRIVADKNVATMKMLMMK